MSVTEAKKTAKMTRRGKSAAWRESACILVCLLMFVSNALCFLVCVFALLGENDPNFVSDVSLIDDTVFNITNNKMNSAQAAAHLREGAEREEREQRDRRRGGDDATGRPAGKMLNVQLKPKSVVVSGAAAQAQGKPSITLSKHAAAGSSSSSSAPSLVLASGRPVVVPARR